MALNYSKKKNLIRSPDEYTRYYGDLRGVDFSSDHTNVHDQRLAYSINMYKDYRAGEGNAIETIPGFRRRFQAPRALTRDGTTYEKINGIHEFETVDENGVRDRDIIVHAGTHLYLWKNYPNTTNVVKQENYLIPESLQIELNEPAAEIVSLEIGTTNCPYAYDLSDDGKTLSLTGFSDYVNKIITVNYREQTITEDKRLKIGLNAEGEGTTPIVMRDMQSQSFVFNNRIYIIDGEHYYVISVLNDKLKKEKRYSAEDISRFAKVPTVYRNISVATPPVDIASHEYEQKNLLCDKYIHTYIADGTTVNYPLYDNDYSSVSVSVYGKTNTAFSISNGVLTFKEAPKSPDKENKPETYAGVELTFTKTDTSIARDEAMIKKCTIATTFDKRIFLTGNPDYPNRIWYCGYNNTTGYEDATYFGELDYVDDGVENAPITGLIPVADTLAAIKNHARQDSSVYFHTRFETTEGIIPVSYPSEPGLNGIGCLGACVNFLDDPVFISRLGVEAIGQLSVRLERAIEHRSSLIDAKLVNLDLTKAKLTEWNGYLVVLASDGKVFMADSRQRYTHDSGVMQYEWYYLEGIGTYEDQVPEYTYSPIKYDDAPNTVTIDDVEYEVTSATNIYNALTMKSENLVNTALLLTSVRKDIGDFHYIVERTWDGKTYDEYNEPLIVYKAILCEHRGGYTGGTFYPATTIVTIDDNIFFGCDNGVVCSFNFDKRESDGTFNAKYYSFDNRTIYCGIATKMDNCGVPHLTKSTIKKSTVIKTKAMRASVAKVKIRTNNKGYESLARVTSRVFGFDDMDFSDFSFISTDQTIFAIKEKEKHWVEKQHWIYSDEFCRPFSINYVAFRYKISGRIKG